MLVEDRYFYDPFADKYTVDRYLDDLESRFGGIDSIILWAVYPNIGIDNRNQNDHLHDLPGGLDAVKNVVADFHRRGVRVVLPIMPWDTGTRAKSAPGWKMLLNDIRRIDADGVFGDTMIGMSEELQNAMNESGRMLALQPEVEAPDCAFAAGNIISWGSWPFQVPKPSVGKYKWFEPRHQINLCHRWETDRTDQLQTAFFNGIGYEVWENIWGIWNGLTPRDCHALRRIAAIQRTLVDLTVSADWEPYAPAMRESEGVFAAKFPGRGQTLYVLVNCGEKTLDDEQIRVPMKPGTRYFNLWHGVELKPSVQGGQSHIRSGAAAGLSSSAVSKPPGITAGQASSGTQGEVAAVPDSVALSFEIEGRGYGAVLAVEDGKPSAEVERLLARAAEWSKVKLADLSAAWKPLPQRIVEIERTPPARKAPEGMVAIPAGKYRFRVSGVMIEGENTPGVDVQYPWEDFPRRHHDKKLDIDAFYIDKYPVTNAEFKRFLDTAGYRPRDGHNFLRDWKDGIYPPGWEKRPVTWVSIEDARAYAAWAGKRLPHEWEWQYAAQGTDGRPFPWGKEPDPEAMPKPDDAPELRGPDDVDAHPRGASPFGAMDMMGNIWHWTDEYHDEHTRAAVLRGGSYYRPAKGWWYFPRNTKLDQHGKYLLMAPSRDRSGTIGFRCVLDM
ncbi:MAG: formylglycine-generating enzyme family protein [Pirellulaceae bacterium]|nr:formylglycine-generating enzyme family protein [Pirellulaceae bacterium]